MKTFLEEDLYQSHSGEVCQHQEENPFFLFLLGLHLLHYELFYIDVSKGKKTTEY